MHFPGGRGIGSDGRKVLLALMAGSKEDTETVRAFFQDMRASGLGDPFLSSRTARPGSFGQSRSDFRARPDSAAWPIGCGTSP